ncbi:MAG: glutamate formiminotransferase [Actinomycetota bacterium]|nr:glutamate formiminotransferase [Actinomycetota bacterium]
MPDVPILGTALNLSEGRRPRLIDAVASAAGRHSPVIDVSPDPDHHRTVITIGGEPDQLLEAAVAATRVAIDQIDLRLHDGAHPRTGAVDVIPFTPWRSAPMSAAVACALQCCERLAGELGVPCFLYEKACPRSGEKASLPWVRKQAFKNLPPDCGGPLPHPTAGATVVGARGLLAAFNVNLASDDLATAKAIAAAIRDGPLGRERGVRALAFALFRRGQVQVSTNITKPLSTTAAEVAEAVEQVAERAGISVADTEFVGLVPRACVGDATLLRLRVKPRILEEEIDRLWPTGTGAPPRMAG